MSTVQSNSAGATVISLRSWARRQQAVNDPHGGVTRTPRINVLLGELTRTWHFVLGVDPHYSEQGEHTPTVISSPDEQICRRMLQSLGQTWSSKVVHCEQDNRVCSVLFVWRDDVVSDTKIAGDDALWILDPSSPRVRSVDIQDEYTNWTMPPRDFLRFLLGERSLPA